MDYNFYVAQSGGKPAPEKASLFEQEMYETYRKWLFENYRSHRAPMSIGHHFSQWNGGAYFRALYRFMKEVCRLPDVICGTYGELVKHMEHVKDFQHLSSTRSSQKDRFSHKSISPFADVMITDGSQKESSDTLYDRAQLKKLFPEEPAMWGDLPEAHLEGP